MSIDVYFYVEQRTKAGWRVPCAYAPERDSDWPREFTWMKRRHAGALFLSENACFPFRYDDPPQSRLCDFIAHRWPRQDCGWKTQHQPRWVPFADVLVDLWDDPDGLLIEASVPAADARAFGAGQGQLPVAALEASGWTADRFDRLWLNSQPVSSPIDREHGAGRFAAERTPPSYPMTVTWRGSMRWLLGSQRCDDFQSLRSLGPAADLRVIAILA